MSELHLTPTRRELLEAVHAGNVVDGPNDQGVVHSWLINPPYKPRVVCSRINEAEWAGWVLHVDYTWGLTAEGFRVLGQPTESDVGETGRSDG